MITVPLALVVGQAVLLVVACFVLAAAYRRLAAPAKHEHGHDQVDEAAALVGTALPDLGPVVGGDGSSSPGTLAPRLPGPGEPMVLVYVLPGCETCQGALEGLAPLVRSDGSTPPIHILSVGADSSVDAYQRFGLPIWRSSRNLSDIFGITAYPVFLAVDESGMIRAAGSVHDDEALRSYLSIGENGPAPEHSAQPITITSGP